MQQLMICLQNLRNQMFYILLRFALMYWQQKYEPVANIIDGNAQLYVLSHIPGNFQAETEIAKTINS